MTGGDEAGEDAGDAPGARRSERTVSTFGRHRKAGPPSDKREGGFPLRVLSTPIGAWSSASALYALIALLPISDINRSIGYPDPELTSFWLVFCGGVLALSLVSGGAGYLMAGTPAAWVVGTLLPLLAVCVFALNYVISFSLFDDGRGIREFPAGLRASDFRHASCTAWTSGDEDCELTGTAVACRPGSTSRRAIECTQMSLPIWCLQWSDGCQIRRPFKKSAPGPLIVCLPGAQRATRIGCLKTVLGSELR